MSRSQLEPLEGAFPCLLGAAFMCLSPLRVLYISTLSCNIKKCMQATKSMRSPEKKEARAGVRGTAWGEDREQRGERKKTERSTRRDRDEDRERERERETRETKGMWSSPSLCLAALWLKRRVPGERGGSRPAQSVLSLPWSPACRPQKRTAKPSGRAPFIALGPPSAPKNLQSKHRLSWHELLSI